MRERRGGARCPTVLEDLSPRARSDFREIALLFAERPIDRFQVPPDAASAISECRRNQYGRPAISPDLFAARHSVAPGI